ncbi:39S ribosomal protein L18, mitochondrial [Hylaeus anthracinus]|uniref:39S ribosomal protein L18, mitochondrial n=1 Tax=Hylaeus anthracinus TaxID=313031 RepID=UPI0023B9DF96|nr:39S ribosomal protein L18, mitochondrial [Hylaeus anthracinus]
MFLRTRFGNLLIKRQVQTNSEIIANCKEIRNRNPRNLERLRIARKPIGYSLEKPGFSYWHKFILNISQRYISAEVHHFENGPVITVSSQENGIKSQLYSTNDASAYINVGRIFAQRCLECGITELYVNEDDISGEKINLLLKEVEKGGISLQEPPRYVHRYTAHWLRDEKPWETVE